MALSKIIENSIADSAISSSKLKDFAAAVDLNGVELVLDADADTSITADTDDRIDFKIAGVEHFSFSNSSGDTIIKPMVDAKDIKFQQYDGRTLLDINDGGFVGIANGATGAGAIRIFEDTDNGSNYVGLTAGSISSSLTFTLPTADGSSGQFLKTDGSGALSFDTVSSAADDLTIGDAAVTLSTSSGNITIDATANDSDIIFKGTDNTADITMLTLDGSDAGTAIFNHDIRIADDGQIGSASDADAIVINSSGVVTMNQIPVFSAGINVSGGSIAGTLSTAAQANITSLGTLTTLTVDNVIINGTTIGHTDDTDLITLADGIATVAGEISVTTLDIGGTNVTSTAAELNILDGVTATAAEINLIDGGTARGTTAIADGDGVLINDNGTMRQTTVQTLAAYLDDEITAMPNLVTVGAANTASTVAGIPFYTQSSSIYTHDVSGTDDSAENNSAYGLTALDAITTGDKNTAIGWAAGSAVTTGSENVYVGYLTGGTGVGTSGYNVMIGNEAGEAGTSVSESTFVGFQAGTANTTGSNLLAIGYRAYDAADTENHNLAIGTAALGGSVAGGEYNVAIGNYSLDALTSGDDNTAVGYNAGSGLTTTTANTFIGNGAGQGATTASSNTVVGAYACQSGTLTGNNNVVVGKLAGYNMTSADASVIIGEDAGLETTTANNNVLIGQGAGENITSGGSNTFIGQAAGDGHDAETNNVGIGKGALGGSIAGGEYNVAVGNGAGASLTTADNTVLIGYNAGLNTTTGPASVAIGKEALRDQTTGGGASVGYNIGIGELGLYNVTTAAPNIGIGGFSQASSATGTHQIVLGYNVTGSGDSTFTFGAGSSDTTCSHGATSFSAPSDERWKKDIETSTCGLSFIDDLRPVSFKFKTKGELDESLNDYEKDSTEIAGFTDDSILGFIAQEVKTVIDNHSEFKGSELWKEGLEKQDKRQRISKEALIPILVKAVQELSTEIKKLKGE